jgi:hypothetical protein
MLKLTESLFASLATFSSFAYPENFLTATQRLFHVYGFRCSSSRGTGGSAWNFTGK